MKISDIQELVTLLDLIEPTVEYGTRKMTEKEIRDDISRNGDVLGNYRTKFRGSECLQIIAMRKKYKAMIENAQLFNRKNI